MEHFPHIFKKNSGLILIALLLSVVSSGSLLAGTITVTGTLSSFLTSRRVASASQSYTVSGTSLSANITVTAPSQYEVSTNNSTFSSSVTLTHSGGTVNTTTIYVRMAGTYRGTFSGNITHVSSGSTQQNLAVTGKVNRLPTETYYQGINSPISSNGNGYNDLPVGFTFNFCGTNNTLFNLSANGYIQFPNPNGGKNVNLTTNAPIPESSAPTGLIAVFWDGLYIDTTACYSVLYKTIGSSPNRKLIIQYTNAQFNGTNSPFGTAQIILYEGSNNVRLQYRQLLQTNRSFGQEASVGIEFSGTTGTQYSYNAASLYEGLSILYTPTGSNTYNAADTTTGSYDPILLGTGASAPPGVPDGEAPGPASTSISQLAKFWWKDSPNISSYDGTNGGYRLKVSINADLSSPLLDTVIADTSFRIGTLKQLTGGTTYYWQVTARGSGCVFTSSEIYSFVASTSPPRYATFSPASPLNMGSLAVGSTSSPTTVTITGVNLTGTMTANVTGDYTINGSSSPVTGLTNGSTLQVRFAPTATGSRTGLLTLTGGGLDYDEVYNLTGTGTAATSTITTTGTLSTFATPQGTASTEQSYTVSATGLTANLTVTPPTGYEVSTTSGGTFSSSLTLSPSSGTISSTTIYVRMTGASGGSFSGNIAHTSTGATTQNIAVSGSVRLITVSGTLSAFSTAQGSVSSEQSYTISGSGLAGNITVTAPTGYELSTTSGGTFSSSVTLTQSAGTVSTTTLYVRMTGASGGSFSGNITHTSTGATSQNISVSGTVRAVTVSGTLSSFSTPQGTASTSQSYTVSGSGLAGNITVTAPAGFEIRTGSNSYASTVTLTPTSGSVSSTTIDVRLTGASGGTFSGTIAHSSTGASSPGVAVSGSVRAITTSGSLTAFSTPHGTASTSQSYTVSGTALAGDITITAPSGFEIRTGSNAYSGSVTLTPTSGTVPSTTIDVRLTGATAGSFSGNITHTSSGASSPNMAVSGNAGLIAVTGSLNSFSTPEGTASASQNYTVAASGLSTDLTITAPTGYEIRTGSNAYAGTVTLSPTSGSISSTTIDVRLTGAAAGLFSGNITHVSSGATTQNKAVSGAVGVVTLTGTLSSFSTTQGSASASQNYTVAASGLAGNLTVTAPTGYEIRTGSNAYAGTITLSPSSGSISATTIDVRLAGASAGSFSGNITHASSSATTQNKAVSGTVAGPVISVSGTLSSFSTTQGTASSSQNYTVSGSGLTADITITAPSGYEIRTGSNSYSSTVTLTPTSGIVSSTTIDVRMTGASAGTFSGNIAHTSTSATTQNVAVSGTVTSGVVVPTVTATNYITAIAHTKGTAAGNVTADGGASVTARGVCWNTSGTPTIADTKTTDGTGTGSFTSLMTGLTDATVYYVRAYATNSAGTAYGATVKFTAGRIYVNASASGANEGSIWTDAYTDLATAISRIDSGEVWVATGTYKPTATTDRTISFTAKNNVSLLGGFAGNESAASSRNATSNVTTLSGEIGSAGTSDNSYHVVSGTALNATAIIDGFTITAGNCDGSAASNYDKGAGLYLLGSPFLKRLTITGNAGTQAIGLYNLGAPTISYVTYGSGNTWIVKQ